jgi:hypothetical protein
MSSSDYVRELMDHIADLNKRSRRAREAGESEVGIFWLIDGALLYASNPISLASLSGSRLIRKISHQSEWRTYQRLGMFPGWPFDHHPRGSVEFDADRGEFEILIDRCLAPDAPLFEEIRRLLHLPKETRVVIDEGYRCYACREEDRAG